MELLELVIFGFAGGTLLVQGVAIALAYRMRRLDPADPAPRRTGGRVSVVIAARNEAEDLGPCLDDLLAQTYPDLEIVVVDGGSTDGTAAVARARPRVLLLPEPPLPTGWVGKNWACRTGAAATDGPYLLFADADMRLHPETVARAVDWAETEPADLVTLAPRIVTVGFWERVVLPFYTQMVLTYFRAPEIERPRSRSAVANGQFLLVRRSAYTATGGHDAVAGVVLEDVAIARRFRAAGRPMRFAWAPHLLTTRMYRDRHEMFEGLLKNVHDTRFSLGRQVAFITGLLAFFLLPLAVLPVGLLEHSLPVSAVGAFLYLALFGKHAAFAKASGGRARDGLLFPVAVGFYLVLLGSSIRRGLSGAPLRWKGREYPLRPSAVGPGSPPTP